MSCPILSRLSLDIVGISVTDRCDAAEAAPFALRLMRRLHATAQAARAYQLGRRAHNGSGDERPDIFAFRGIPCFLCVGLLGGGPASAWSAARSASADLTSADLTSACSASGCSASGCSAADSVVVGAATGSPLPHVTRTLACRAPISRVLPCSAADNMKESRRLANGWRPDIAGRRRDDYCDER